MVLRKIIYPSGLFLSLLISSAGSGASAQTCCSGGVPLAGNIGFQGSAKGSLQVELSYDVNYLSTLKAGDELLQDANRLRTTHSLLFKTGYSVTRWFAIDALFSYVIQGRTIDFGGAENRVMTRGIGDAVLLSRFVLSRFRETGLEIQAGLGPKIPLGRSGLTDDRGITLNADLQPGSGSWDLITWGFVGRQVRSRPSMAFSARVVGRINGTNRNYLGNEHYRFGNSIQAQLGWGDQWVIRGQLFAPSLSFRFRKALPDRINGDELDNTGGDWIVAVPSWGWHISPASVIQLVPEIPVYSRVTGTQLTPTFRLRVGFYHSFKREQKNNSKSYNL